MDDKINVGDCDKQKAVDALEKLVVDMAKDGKMLPRTLEYVTSVENEKNINDSIELEKPKVR